MEVEENLQLQTQPQSSPMEVEQIDRRPAALGDLRILPDEVLCAILTFLTPRDVARLSCVSSVMYILCNEEPLWMSICLDIANRQLQYKGSWKRTALDQLNVTFENNESCRKLLHFDGFNSLFLYRRLYRCYTSLNGFYYDTGNVERAKNLSIEEFHDKYDGQKPVLIAGLADTWPASATWTTKELLKKYEDTSFKLSQRSRHKIKMKLKDYVSYIKLQHDEDPLYIFAEKFGETAPELLKDYSVPNIFKEDFFDVLDRDQRPPFRWLIMGPERSGASWHVDPALTSAWNTLLCGRKRWALYPPGRVPLGVTVHINEEDGDVSIDTPSSLQWWMDFYPLLAEEDKPIECTQLPGETIFVPSGWWHCVLNLETTVAVTQNFVNTKNFEFVCLDMAPGYRHKGVCRAGLLALDDISIEDVRRNVLSLDNSLSCSDLLRKQKRIRVDQPANGSENGSTIDGDLGEVEFSYDINFLAMFLDKEREHYTSLWSSSNSIGQREMREWLSKLWVGKPGIRDLIWKGACLALNADRWYTYVAEICTSHGLPLPTDDERLPVGTGSNPVYLAGDNVIKIFVEEGLEACLHSLGTELEFCSLLQKINSPLKNHIPNVLQFNQMAVLTNEQPHFVLFPFMAQGHMIPMIDIARLLAQRGVIITILLTPSNGNRFSTVIARAIEIGLKIQVIDLYFPSSEAGLPEGCENCDMVPSIDMMKNFFLATQMVESQVVDSLQELNPLPSCLISDMCFPWTTNVAKKFNIPRIVFHGMCSFSLLCLHNLREGKVLENANSDTEYFSVPGFPDKVELTKAQLKTLVDPSNPEWNEFGEKIKEAEDEAYGIVVNSFEELEPEYVKRLKKAKGKKIWTIGPVSLCNKEKQDKAERGSKASIDEHHCLKWLNSKEPDSVLFVCLGSLSRLPASQMIELGLALESSKRPFIWVIRHISDELKKWLNEENFEERIKEQGILIHGWAPQVLILSHASVGGFVTHCGWNSSIEGISTGVPMITWPLFAEQFCNERLITNVLKTGVKSGVENPVMFLEEEKVDTQVNKDDIKMVIEKLMGEEEEAKIRRERAKKLGEIARKAVEEGGSSHLNLTILIQDVKEQANFLENQFDV